MAEISLDLLRCTFNPFSFLQRQFYLQSNFKVAQCVNSRAMLSIYHGHKVTILQILNVIAPKRPTSNICNNFLSSNAASNPDMTFFGRRRWHQLVVGTFVTKPSLGLNPQVRVGKGGLAIDYKLVQATMTHLNDRGMQ